ncbi:HipA domain-containing protein [Priestia megaterium]|uniref:HipA domain-containing protein n=1 Tax=Priestia megaterium TaxID=1404 RepID=UPI00211D5A11|nr:HipA domain-containing protein [Priestia megaterium]
MISDISHWERDDRLNASGTREKFWLINPENEERYMFKLPKEGTGEIWAEKVASEIGKVLKLEMMDVAIAKYEDRQGLLLTNFVKYGEEEHFDGGDLLKTIIDGFDPNDLTDYTLENILRCLVPLNLEKEIVKVIIFDALIGNQDRHCENWGVIQKGGDIRLTPIYDNGASLGFSNKEERVEMMLKDANMFGAFTNRGKSIIGIPSKKKPKIKALLHEIYALFPGVVSEEIERLDYLQTEEIKHILEIIPLDIMSETYKIWVERLLIYRKEWIINWYEGELNND